MDDRAMEWPIRDGWQAQGAHYEYQAQGAHYEYRVLTLRETTNPREARRLLTDEAEYGSWELARSLVFPGGRRKVWLRRRIIKVSRTL